MKFLHSLALGLMSAGAVTASASEPRVEEVRDGHGRPWSVLIVPRGGLDVTVRPAIEAPAPAPAVDLPMVQPAETDFQLTAHMPLLATSLVNDGPQFQAPLAEPVHAEPAKAESPEEAVADSANSQEDADEKMAWSESLPGHLPVPPRVNPCDYARVYWSLPFIRSEYEANPSYRHEATMEILFGQLRPTVNVKQPPRAMSSVPRANSSYTPFGYDLFPDGYTVYGFGRPFYRPFGIGYPGAYWTLPPYFSYSGAYGYPPQYGVTF